MLVEVAGHTIDVSGDPSDPYFNAAGAHAAQLMDLSEPLSGIPEDAVIFDVGANIGLSTLTMAIIKPRARIFAFEPGPRTSSFLRRNTAHLPNVEVVAAAVSDRPGTLHFHIPGDSSGSHVVGAGHMAGAPSVPVPCITLDAFCAERGVAPDFMKIDVEGHEPEVIAGGAKTLETARPLMHTEINSWCLLAWGGHNPSSFLAAVYRAFDVEGDGGALELLHRNLLRDGCVTDIAMRLKPGAVVPTLAEMSYSPAARREIDALAARLTPPSAAYVDERMGAALRG